MADAKTANGKPKATRNLGPRVLNVVHKGLDDNGSDLKDAKVVTNMEDLVAALQGGGRYTKIALPQRKPRAAA